MHKYLILFFSVSLFLCGCKSDKVPSEFIQPPVMVGLLTEIHLIDGSLYVGAQGQDSLYKYGMGKYLAAFKRFGTDSATFRKSMDYYTTEPTKLAAIYDKIDARLKGMTDSLSNIETVKRKAAHKTDSLKALRLKKLGNVPLTPAQKADSVKHANMKQGNNTQADYIKRVRTMDSLRIDSAKKLNKKLKRKLKLKRLHAVSPK